MNLAQTVFPAPLSPLYKSNPHKHYCNASHLNTIDIEIMAWKNGNQTHTFVESTQAHRNSKHFISGPHLEFNA